MPPLFCLKQTQDSSTFLWHSPHQPDSNISIRFPTTAFGHSLNETPHFELNQPWLIKFHIDSFTFVTFMYSTEIPSQQDMITFRHIIVSHKLRLLSWCDACVEFWKLQPRTENRDLSSVPVHLSVYVPCLVHRTDQAKDALDLLCQTEMCLDFKAVCQVLCKLLASKSVGTVGSLCVAKS